ncbi:MAG TPA: 1,4-dihydroxy-2-naphthoate polyprenyltransferase [Pseudonocardiaceae bacterium]|jgi:1,4-dihydroxy-2-naphthoate octaprenyltransferase|nr:1,4-dihydroxy-2-naphthoate polyprenyltransferase [Pseudonocardiaceae bacterium]
MTLAQWVEGARPRTLPNAVAPVLAGWGAAAALGPLNWVQALLALAVALGLVIGVNYANDYSDGVRGTDSARVGPMRLVGSGAATPAAVRMAALASLGFAAMAGLVLVALAEKWWLLAVGVASITAAWFYTGGRRPYGYGGWGEVAVFLFFGPVAVLGTQYVLAERITGSGAAAAVAMGALSAAVLVANNLRDIPTDAAVGKRTLAVRLGASRTRRLYVALVVVPFVVTLGLALTRPTALVGLIALVLAVRPVRRVLTGAGGRALILVLRDTGLTMLVWAAATAAALAWSAPY